jgi:hypothetical protein
VNSLDGGRGGHVGCRVSVTPAVGFRSAVRWESGAQPGANPGRGAGATVSDRAFGGPSPTLQRCPRRRGRFGFFSLAARSRPQVRSPQSTVSFRSARTKVNTEVEPSWVSCRASTRSRLRLSSQHRNSAGIQSSKAGPQQIAAAPDPRGPSRSLSSFSRRMRLSRSGVVSRVTRRSGSIAFRYCRIESRFVPISAQRPPVFGHDGG